MGNNRNLNLHPQPYLHILARIVGDIVHDSPALTGLAHLVGVGRPVDAVRTRANHLIDVEDELSVIGGNDNVENGMDNVGELGEIEGSEMVKLPKNSDTRKVNVILLVHCCEVMGDVIMFFFVYY